MRRFVNWFLQGLIYLAPIAITAWLFTATFRVVDDAVASLIGAKVPGVGVAVMIVFTTGFGFLLSNYLAARLLGLLEDAIDRLPFAKLLHGSMKDLMNAFVGEQRRFKQPVAVELIPGSGVRAFGFITRQSMAEVGFADDVGVYFPQAYNFAGQLLMVPRERITLLKAESPDVMTLIVSGGVALAHSKTDMKAVK
jgi:uncharacterized membrane protein